MAILSTLSPADIQLWVETVLVYLATFAAAIVTAATATLRTLNIILPILEEWYPREGRGVEAENLGLHRQSSLDYPKALGRWTAPKPTDDALHTQTIQTS
jgi:hypothetical protein